MKLVKYKNMNYELQPNQAIALIGEFGCGNWGRTRKRVCVVRLYFFKSGGYKTTRFDIIKEIEIVEKGYGWQNQFKSGKILEIIEMGESK